MTISLEAFFLHTRFSDLDKGLLERGELIAHQLASSSEYGVFSNNTLFLQNIGQGVLQQPDVRSVVILNAASEPLIAVGGLFEAYANANVEVSDFIKQNSFNHFREVNSSENLLTTIRHSRDGLWIFQPILPAQVVLNELDAHPTVRHLGVAIVEMSNARVLEIKNQTLIYTILATLLFFSGALYLIHLAGRRITNPIRTLSEAIQTIGEGNLETRVSVFTRIRELNTLARGINDMAEQLLQDRMLLQRRVDEATAELRDKKEGAERANHDKSRFLAAASHDMRQPIHALGLYLAELRRKISGAEQQRLIGQVEHSVDAISALINSLLDISKLDAGVVVPQKQTCDLSALLERLAADFKMLAHIKNIRLMLRPFQGYAVSDPVLLERILMNLLSNALRYTHPGGTVLIACRKRGNQLRIEVRDNGIGIAQADQANIFREFFQLAQPQPDTQNGAGLGLAIVDRLVKLLGHHIALRSAPGKGSLFALELTAAPRPVAYAAIADFSVLPTSGPHNEVVPLAGKKLLVVDDDELVLDSTATLLTSWGCVVSVAASLEAVQNLLDEGAVWDFLISDYALGDDVTGLDVIAMVRQHIGRPTPCMLISGDTCPAIMKLADEAGYALLHKPVKPAKLRSLMQYLLTKNTTDETQSATARD
ncbi:MAG: ATP-binding protein [Gallionella sp.]|nr:ATP-binding protein [Gallionella sp.]